VNRQPTHHFLFYLTSACEKRDIVTATPSVTRVDQSQTVEVRIIQFSPYGRTIPLVFAW